MLQNLIFTMLHQNKNPVFAEFLERGIEVCYGLAS